MSDSGTQVRRQNSLLYSKADECGWDEVGSGKLDWEMMSKFVTVLADGVSSKDHV